MPTLKFEPIIFPKVTFSDHGARHPQGRAAMPLANASSPRRFPCNAGCRHWFPQKRSTRFPNNVALRTPQEKKDNHSAREDGVARSLLQPLHTLLLGLTPRPLLPHRESLSRQAPLALELLFLGIPACTSTTLKRYEVVCPGIVPPTVCPG